MIRRTASMAVGLNPGARTELPLTGSFPLNPIGRLVLTGAA